MFCSPSPPSVSLLPCVGVTTKLKGGYCLSVSLSFTTEVEEEKQFMLTLVKWGGKWPSQPTSYEKLSQLLLPNLAFQFFSKTGKEWVEMRSRWSTLASKLGIELPGEEQDAWLSNKDAFQWVPPAPGGLGCDVCLSVFLLGSMCPFPECKSFHKLINEQKNADLKSIQKLFYWGWGVLS